MTSPTADPAVVDVSHSMAAVSSLLSVTTTDDDTPLSAGGPLAGVTTTDSVAEVSDTLVGPKLSVVGAVVDTELAVNPAVLGSTVPATGGPSLTVGGP